MEENIAKLNSSDVNLEKIPADESLTDDMKSSLPAMIVSSTPPSEGETSQKLETVSSSTDSNSPSSESIAPVNNNVEKKEEKTVAPAVIRLKIPTLSDPEKKNENQPNTNEVSKTIQAISEERNNSLPPTEEKKEEVKDAEIPLQNSKLPRINFSAMQKTREESAQKAAENKAANQKILDNTPKDSTENAPELFNNYKPSFDGRAKKFFDQLRERRIKPKTRTSLVLFLIISTFLFVSYLFYFHPEKHSLEIYEANIIGIFQKKEAIKNPPLNMETTEIPPTIDTEEPTLSGTTDEGSGTVNEEIPHTNSGGKLDEFRKQKIKNYFLK